MALQSSTWLGQLPQPTLEPFRLLYGNNIPEDVRNHIANWIQAQFINAPAFYDDQNAIDDMYEEAAKFLNKLIDKLRCTGALYANDIKHELDGTACILLQLFSRDPIALYQELINCLQQHPYYCINLDAIERTEVWREFQELKVMVHGNENDKGSLIMVHGYLAHAISEVQNVQATINTAKQPEERMLAQFQLVRYQAVANDRLQKFSEMQFAVASGFRTAIDKTGKLQDKVLKKYLAQWKINQRLAAIGAYAKLESDLDTIQLWCESLMEIILRTKEQIMQTMQLKSEGYVNLSADPVLTPAMKDVTNLLETLIYNSFVVEQQPPQILRMHNRFSASVRLLVGTTLCDQVNPPLVSVSIISEAQARAVHRMKGAATTSAVGVILNNVGQMQYNTQTKQFSAVLGKLCMKKITRMFGKQNHNCVLDEKLALLFQATIATVRKDLVLPIRTVSWPVVGIVHVSQDQKSCATIIWENVFAKISHTTFDVPKLVLWNWLADVLSMRFSGSRDHPLSADHIHFLCEKALGTEVPFPIPNGLTITWSQFCKDNLPDCSSTFWGWFYQVMKLTRDHFLEQWTQGRIFGFIRKSKAEQYLASCKPGTFLLRFSDTVLGGITIGFVHENSVGQLEILHIEPFTARDLSIRSLADRILDFDVLTHLYPCTPKHEAFQRRNAERARSTNYIATELRAILIFPPVDMTTDESCDTSQGQSVKSEYTFSNIDSMSFFDLDTTELLTVDDSFKDEHV
uniref:Signal transducer and activator of transcription n=1 Tax=Anopheles stephensi TaxID=30069 RepID=A0A0K0V6D8_ANOST|nr:signal transducer and activator of transcription B [Anopheles stephensi]